MILVGGKGSKHRSRSQTLIQQCMFPCNKCLLQSNNAAPFSPVVPNSDVGVGFYKIISLILHLGPEAITIRAPPF